MNMATNTGGQDLRRGTILRDTNSGPGLLSVAGQQWPFTLEQHWRSERPPVSGAKVDVLFDAGVPARVQLVDEGQIAKEMATQAAGELAQRGRRLWGRALAEFGPVPPLALLAVLIGWWGLDWVSVRVMGSQVASYSLWDLLKMLAMGNALDAMRFAQQGSAGLWGLLAVLAVAAPLSPLLWRDRRANLGLLLPLLFMLLQALRLYWGISSAVSAMQAQMSAAAFGASAARLTQEMSAQIFQAISLGLGLYLSVAAGLVLAVYGLVRLRR